MWLMLIIAIGTVLILIRSDVRSDADKVSVVVAIIITVMALVAMMNMVARGEYVKPFEGLNVRSQPTTDSESLGVLEFGTEVVAVDDEPLSGWMAVSYNDRLGYVSKKHLSKTDPLEDLDSLGTWHITAYAATGWPCANGNYPTAGYTIAHNSLPFGTKVYIEGVGVRVVEDRGPAWLGDEWCDLYLGDYWPCVEWGSQYREVWLID